MFFKFRCGLPLIKHFFLCRVYCLIYKRSIAGKTRILPMTVVLMIEWKSYVLIFNTQRGRSRAQHVPRPRGRRRGGEKFGPGAFATLERVVFSCKGAERDEWRGPKCRADALAVVVLWQKDHRADEPIFLASDLKRQIIALVVSP